MLVFIDEMSYRIWPDPAPTWAPPAPASAPVADRQESSNALWRVIGSLNAWNGKVNFLDNYIVGRRQLIEMYQQIDKTYAHAKTIYVVQDNWSIHTHPDVLIALEMHPRIEPIWLPTYAPWLNPIEKLWRWLKETVLKMHRSAADWPELQGRVNGFLRQFARGSQKLLRYVGLLGDGQLAQRAPYRVITKVECQNSSGRGRVRARVLGSALNGGASGSKSRSTVLALWQAPHTRESRQREPRSGSSE